MFSFGLYMYAYMYTPNTYTSPTHIRTHAHMHMPSTHTQSLISELLKKHIAIYSTNTRYCKLQGFKWLYCTLDAQPVFI